MQRVPLLVPSVLVLPRFAASGTSSSPLDIVLLQGGPLRCNSTPNAVSSGRKKASKSLRSTSPCEDRLESSD
ncbi:hypothetical protein DEU56DRAFT_776328 [Suillus clintonianus]|uniref:uncharacterized protein n=1 Tax=Suillus clintonianus TaxID=1904413 RepID=UPI001B86A143|nr:uncharacterized protein DEU56DRAFT_776328 [Suillus clintonianus]KAG2152816.1 hypothetical protein DEU56DRAFT_776328 [Suillus clintonianus]